MASKRYNTQEIARLYFDEKWSTQKIARYLDASVATVYYHLKKTGRPTRSHKEAQAEYLKHNPPQRSVTDASIKNYYEKEENFKIEKAKQEDPFVEWRLDDQIEG